MLSKISYRQPPHRRPRGAARRVTVLTAVAMSAAASISVPTTAHGAPAPLALTVTPAAVRPGGSVSIGVVGRKAHASCSLSAKGAAIGRSLPKKLTHIVVPKKTKIGKIVLTARCGGRVAKTHFAVTLTGSDHPQNPLVSSSLPVTSVDVIGRGGAGDPGDDYPAVLKNAPQDSLIDQWREYNRECTSFAAWALASRNGFNMPFNDNAVGWAANARARGFSVDSNPSAGSIAWSNIGKYGHVAYVQGVSGNSVHIEEYNRDGYGHYSSRVVPAQAFTGYIHFSDRAIGVSNPGGATTNPGTPGRAVGAGQLAFQANTGSLWDAGVAGTHDYQQGMMPGTSPSIARLSNGGHEMAFQANTGDLIVFGDAGNANLHLGMMAGTNPAITGLPSGGYQVAFQANTGSLWSAGSAGTHDYQQGMMGGTSPAIASLGGSRFQMAFQANTGDLIVFGDGGNANLRLGMKAGTSPAIAGLAGGGYQAVFQANTGSLWSAGSAGTHDYQQGMMDHTSPAAAGLATGGFEMAFQANTGELIVFGDAGNANLHLGMRAGTSPAIAGLAGSGYQVAFQANTGSLWGTGSAGTSDYGLGMLDGTSPSIAP